MFKDEIVVFSYSSYSFHKSCYTLMTEELEQLENNHYNNLEFGDIIDDSYLETIENKQ